ncbi:MAG: hypothetical protein QME89_02295 [Actinomycetota bacterium]|nr:hypothetical protein [Actinomycetota bacterium]MDI7251365.1 hypothetical protein [Actinomycetota bacterium]
MNTWRNLPGKAWVSLLAMDPRLRGRGERASAELTTEERRLFASMDRYDRAHSLAVASRLRDDPLLFRAALLHDCGKLTAELHLWVRWAYTFLEVFMPRLLARLVKRVEKEARGKDVLERMRSLPPGWRRGLYVQVHHGEVGAALLELAGSEEELVQLVREHQGEPRDERSRRLRRLDDAL